MERTRYVPADPVRSISETIAAITDLLVGALPSVDEEHVRGAIGAIHSPIRFLVGTETTVTMPLTVVAGVLKCDIFTVHGESALEAEMPSVPLGAADATDWVLYVPVPQGAPFTSGDLAAGGTNIKAGPAPEAVRRAKENGANGAATEIDIEALRRATQR
jgi:hypothetical protein